jgi:hypothetical protein
MYAFFQSGYQAAGSYSGNACYLYFDKSLAKESMPSSLYGRYTSGAGELVAG